MSLIPQFSHNGVSIERTPAPPPIGPLGNTVFGIVGTAPDADPSLPRNEPIRMANLGDAAALDIVGNEAGTLWRTVFETFRLVASTFYVVIVDEGVGLVSTESNIIGGVDGLTGQLTGIEALSACRETPTHICAPGFGSRPVADALVAMGKRLFAIPVGDGPSTNNQDAVDFSISLPGAGTGYEAYYLVEPQVSVFSRAAGGNVNFSAAAIALSNFARVQRWESPARGGLGALIQGVSRVIDYNILDPNTSGGLLNRHGISYFAQTALGGFSLIGNRSVTGRFINQVGLEHAILRQLTGTAQRAMARNLTQNFIEQEITRINVFLKSLQANETLIGAEVYLHPTLNNVANYQNGEWHIAIRYHGFAPNEHMVYHLIEDTGIIEAYLEEIL
jgi:phage tail sheath protein FI